MKRSSFGCGLLYVWYVWISLVLFVFPVFAAPKERQSHKKRLAAAEAANAELQSRVDLESTSSSSSSRSMRQRLMAADAAEAAGVDPCDKQWAQKLKRDWAAGKISAKQVQEYAAASTASGAHGVGDLAATGAHGRHPSSIHRALMRIFGHPAGAPEIDWVEIPTKKGRVAHPFLFPHKFFSALHQHRRDLFVRAIRGPEGAARQYWETLGNLGNPFVANHPLLTDFDHALPIGVHGDAGAFTKHDSLMVISWNGLLGQGQTRVKRFVFTFVRKVDYTKETLDRIFELLAWSVNAMARGETPALDWDRKPLLQAPGRLAGLYSAVLAQVRGDWQFYVEIFQLPPWNGALRMCWLCRASSALESLSFNNCGPNAGWRHTRFTDESYRAHLRGLGMAIPVLLLFVIGLRLECIMIDALHSLDLGYTSHCIANTMWEGIRRRVWGGANQEENAEILNRDMIKHCKDNRVPSRIQGALTKERIRTTTGS